MTNEEMLAQMRGPAGFHSFGASKVQRMFCIRYSMAYDWIDWCFCYTSDFDLTDILVTDDPRATIDELIAAEAAGGGK